MLIKNEPSAPSGQTQSDQSGQIDLAPPLVASCQEPSYISLTRRQEESNCNTLAGNASKPCDSFNQQQQPQSQPQQPSSTLITQLNNDCASTQLHTTSNGPADPLQEDGREFVTIIHFNDCYNIEPNAKSSGAAGFLTAINQYRHLNPMILFSGDILSPSFMSTFTKGEQMIPVLNDIGVDCAVFGNHEFDYGVDNLIDFTKRTNFPWLLSNVIDKETSNQLGDGLVYHVLERSGLRFGLIGLIEEEWLSTLSTLDSSDVIYEDFVVKGRKLARWLKTDLQVDYVVALTHFRTPNDIRLADSVPEIDLVLGGHDHDYEIIKRPNCHVIKSGTDFREFSLIKLKLNAQYLGKRKPLLVDDNAMQASTMMTTIVTEKNSEIESHEGKSTTHQQQLAINTNGYETLRPFSGINIERIECISFPPDANLQRKLEKFVTSIDEKMGKVLGQFNCELDGRFSSIRKFETNLGNFVCDIMLASTHADLAILNSGTLRSDRIHPKGDFTMRDLFNILGYIDPIAVLQAAGKQVLLALENGVSQWPKLEGRFPQVSGCSFVFDPSKPPFERIDPKHVLIGDEPLDLNKHYRLTTKAYLASGKDGYDTLKECTVLVPGDESPDLTTSILNHFEAINIVKSNRRTHHRQSIICLSRSSIQRLLDQSGGALSPESNEVAASGGVTSTPNMKPSIEGGRHLDNDNNNNGHGVTPTIMVAARRSMPTQLEKISKELSDELNCKAGDSFIAVADPTVGATSTTTTTAITSTVDEDDCDQFSVDDSVVDCPRDSGYDAMGAPSQSRPGQFARPRRLQRVAKGPSASSPLVGSTAPTPTLSNMASSSLGATGIDLSASCDACGTTMATPPSTIARPAARQPRTKRMMSLYEMECEQCKLEPKVEGRIKILGINWP